MQREARRLERLQRRRRWRTRFGIAVYAPIVERAIEKVKAGGDLEAALLCLAASERACVRDALGIGEGE